ncbi:MAG: hypothetical protein FWE05_00615 [Defluviitaleaceae bacterium]|nr:hypothetical protein [Defluviitaleaceae bacterium]
MAYERFFMPLENEATGYDFKGRSPSGRCIVESKDANNGKLTLWIQDLKPETRYGIYIIFPDGGRYSGVNLGSLAVDVKGKAEVRRDLDESNLNGYKISNFQAIAITAPDAHGTTSPLCGYRERQFAWRSSFYVAAKKIESPVVSKEEMEALIDLPKHEKPKPPEIPEPEIVNMPEPEMIEEPVEAIAEPEPPKPIEEIPEPVIEPIAEPEPEIEEPLRAPKARKPKGAKPTSRRAIIQTAIEDTNEEEYLG